MDIIFNSLYKLDIVNNVLEPLPLPADDNDLKSYIIQLLDKILNDADRKGFEFQSETTEVRVLIDRILRTADGDMDAYHVHSRGIAERLLAKEIESQSRMNLKVELVKGIVVVSLVRFTDRPDKIIISKADYNEYLDAESYKNRTGFPLKKKIYKAFIADADELHNITRVAVFDTNSVFTVYWWRDFLELKEVHTDEFNTENAFDAIEEAVLDPIKKKHKADYINLWNATVHYFRVKDEFSADDFISQIISGYRPFDPSLNTTELETKARKEFSKEKFDNRFAIVSGVVSKRFKKSISLTPQIDLNFKSDIQNLDNTIMRYKEPNGEKWVMIRSSEGYEYFKDTNIMS